MTLTTSSDHYQKYHTFYVGPWKTPFTVHSSLLVDQLFPYADLGQLTPSELLLEANEAIVIAKNVPDICDLALLQPAGSTPIRSSI